MAKKDPQSMKSMKAAKYNTGIKIAQINLKYSRLIYPAILLKKQSIEKLIVCTGLPTLLVNVDRAEGKLSWKVVRVLTI